MPEILEPPVPIIILNWNGLEDTRECMSSVLSLKDIKYEVYLIDNNSDNFEGDLLIKEYNHLKHVHVIKNSKNLGFTRGNNRIMKDLILKEDVEYIALLNNDTVVTPNWLNFLVASARQNNADMVSSKMINYYDRSIMDNAGHFMLNTAEILPVGHAKPINEFRTVQQNIGACGGGALYSSKMLKEIGLFDEFFDTGYEDAEFGLRANKLGFYTIFEPTAIIYHKVSRSIKKIRDENYFIKIQRNIFYTYAKLMPKTYVLYNAPFILLKYLFIFFGTIVTLKFNIIKLHSKTIVLFFTQDFKNALASRKAMSPISLISRDRKFTDRISFFLKTDIRRFILLFRNTPLI